MADPLKQSENAIAIEKTFGDTPFEDFEAQLAEVKSAKYYESEQLWVINVNYQGETYVLRPDSKLLPIDSTAEDVLLEVQRILLETNKRKPSASPDIKTLQQQVVRKRGIDFVEKRTGLPLDLLIKTKTPYEAGQLIYNIYNGYIDENDFKNGYVDLDTSELIASIDAADISADELNPTRQVIDKQFADGSVITFIINDGGIVKYAAYVKLTTSKDNATDMIPFSSSDEISIGGIDGSSRLVLTPNSDAAKS